MQPFDPIREYARKATASRRVGQDARCACGESRPEALLPGSKPMRCAECERMKNGHSTIDQHHCAGEANNPTTVPIPVNDHRAELSVDQYHWPKNTLENPCGSPLLARAACIRGFIDTVVYMLKRLLLPGAEMLEILDAFLKDELGPKWWENTPLEQFASKPKRKQNANPSTGSSASRNSRIPRGKGFRGK